ncbi:hypothetical protein [Candidatus Methanocrinis alkalitolerans]|nr:hypothetical protein [Candidatus Methanocrinis alkalitolerans]
METIKTTLRICILSVLLFSLSTSSFAAENMNDVMDGCVLPTPDRFDKFLAYMGAGVYVPDDPDYTAPDYMYFQKDIMGRDEAGIEADRTAAMQYFLETFGLDFFGEEVVEDPTSVEAMSPQGACQMAELCDIEGVATFNGFMLDPRQEYRAYAVSEMTAPAEGWAVRDGGWMVMTIEETTLYGTWGGEDGKVVPAGSMLVFGDYNIDTGDQPIIIHYHSGSPIIPGAEGIMFLCVLTNPEFGEGRAQGIMVPKTLEDGRAQTNIRNILTFPSYGIPPEA